MSNKLPEEIKSYEVLKRWIYKGLNCVVVLGKKNESYYCGYVGVPHGHPDWGKPDEKVKVKVHGDLSFSEQGRTQRPNGTPEDIWVDENLWWFGFDSHNSVGFDEQHHMIFEEASLEEVVSWTESLAKQLEAHSARTNLK